MVTWKETLTTLLKGTSAVYFFDLKSELDTKRDIDFYWTTFYLFFFDVHFVTVLIFLLNFSSSDTFKSVKRAKYLLHMKYNNRR